MKPHGKSLTTHTHTHKAALVEVIYETHNGRLSRLQASDVSSQIIISQA